MKKFGLLILSSFCFLFTGCDLLSQIGGSLGTPNPSDEVNAYIKELVPVTESTIDVTSTFDNSILEENDIYSVVSLLNSSEEEFARCYFVNTNGYNSDLNFVVALSTINETSLGLSVISHKETESMGGAMLSSPEFIDEFNNVPIGDLYEGVDGYGGATITLKGVNNAMKKVIAFHKDIYFPNSEYNTNLEKIKNELGLNDSIVTIKTKEFDEALKNNTGSASYDRIKKNLGLVDFIEISTGGITKHVYIVEGSYNYEASHGARENRNYTFAFVFDEDLNNTKAIILNENETISSPRVTVEQLEIWLDENFKNYSLSDLEERLSNYEIDSLQGATFTSSKYINHIKYIIDAHTKAFK